MKKLIICSLLICCVLSGMYAADNELDVPIQIVDKKLPAEAEGSAFDKREQEQLSAQHTASFFSAFGSVSCKVFSATLLLSNTFGRLALAGCLAYKAYESATKTLENDAKRIKYALKTVCCFGAACMLLQDGYQWILRQADLL